MIVERRSVELDYAGWKVVLAGDYTPNTAENEGHGANFVADEVQVIGPDEPFPVGSEAGAQAHNFRDLFAALDILEDMEVQAFEILVAEGS